MQTIDLSLDTMRRYAGLDLKFIIQNVDLGADVEANVQVLIQRLENGTLDRETLVESVGKHAFAKVRTLNLIATRCCEAGLHLACLPLFKAALDLDGDNPRTLFNVGYFLSRIGERDLALEHLEKIQPQDAELRDLIGQLRLQSGRGR